MQQVDELIKKVETLISPDCESPKIVMLDIIASANVIKEEHSKVCMALGLSEAKLEAAAEVINEMDDYVTVGHPLDTIEIRLKNGNLLIQQCVDAFADCLRNPRVDLKSLSTTLCALAGSIGL